METCPEHPAKPGSSTYLLWGKRAQHRGVANTRLERRVLARFGKLWPKGAPSLHPTPCLDTAPRGGDIEASTGIGFWLRKEPPEQ